MEFRDALKYLRKEIGLTQMELANALHINFTTVSRWETGKTVPNRAMTAALLELAKARCTSEVCLRELQRAVSAAARDKLDVNVGHTFGAEYACMRQMVDDSSYPIYVADIETDEILYLNRMAEKLVGCMPGGLPDGKCYRTIMHRDEPCPFCGKEELTEECFTNCDLPLTIDGRDYLSQGKLIQWNGRRAQARCIIEDNSSQRLKPLIENINGGVSVVVFGHDGSVRLAYANESYYRTFGYTKEQFFAELREPKDAVLPEDVEYTASMIEQVKKTHKPADFKYRIIKRDKSIGHVRCCSSADEIASLGGTVLISVITDITEAVEADEKLLEQENRINELLNMTPGGIAVVEVDPKDIPGSLHTTYYNDHFFRYSGYSREEYDALLNNDEFRLVFDEDIPALVEATQKMCESPIGASVDCTVRCHTKSGDYRWLLLTGELAEKRDGVCVIYIVMVDVTASKEAQDRQRISEEMLRIAAETDKRALVIYDIKANTCRVESRHLYSAQYDEAFENVPDSLIERGIVASESADELRRLFARLRAGETKTSVSLQLWTGDGEFQWFECNATVVFDADGQPDHAALVLHNITEQRIKEAVYKKWQQSIKTRPAESYTLFRCNLSKDSSLDEQDGELLKIHYSPEARSFDSRTKEYAEQYVYPDDREEYEALLESNALLARFYRGEHTTSLEYREMGEKGNNPWRRLTVEMVEYLNSTDVQAFLMYEDIDEEKRTQLRERELAETDPLTGALNRTAFSDRVDRCIGSGSGVQHALLMLDVDGFKLLNDTFGHAAGDQALMDISAVLRSVIREDDFLCRLGGDEFLVWLHDIPYDAVIEKKAKQMCSLVRRAYSLEVQLTVSMGIAVCSRDGQDFDTLYRNADTALYKVKQSGKDNYEFYSADGGEVHADDSTCDGTENETIIRTPAKPKRRMLIVDDSEETLMMLRGIFQDAYLIETARNGSDAMMRLRHFGSAISVVLLDLFMPGIDGFEVLKKMQSNIELRTIPVIVVSCDTDYNTNLQAIEAGAADYVTKPVDANLIRLRVQSAVSKTDNERLRAQNSYLQLQRDEEIKFRTVLESTGTVVVEYDWRTHIFSYDSVISQYIAGNYNNRGLWNVFLSDMVADIADVKELQEMMLALANNRDENRANKLVMLKTPHKAKHWFRMNVYKQMDDFGLAEKMIITFNDVHDEVRANEKLLFQATRDELTGLYNRSGFIEKATELIAGKPSGYYVLASIDIEKFKVINEQYGNETGDEVLRQFANALSEMDKSSEGICCRVSADNFAILYPKDLADMSTANKAHSVVPTLGGALPQIKFYVGLCHVDDKALSVSSIYVRAAMAKDTVKGRYDTNVATYDESMRTGILHQQKITGQMKSALESGQFEVWLQPQYNHAAKTLIGAEALVRWRSPEDGLIPPGEFIPIFERNGFIYELDKYVWEQSCILLRRWLDNGHKPVPVSVNLSRYDMFRSDLPDVLKGLMAKYKLPVELLRLEITESAFAESSRTIVQVVNELIKYGFTVEIDDFGSGYSSLNTLKDVPADILKLDMRFLENTKNSQRGGNIVESVVRMAKWIGVSVIAEGVETREQADYLKSIGCHYIQGYLYAKPMPAFEYEQLMSSSEKERELAHLETLTTYNNNAFWDPKSMDTLIFNSYVGGACIFEYNNGEMELLRTNEQYERELGAFGADRRELITAKSAPHMDEENREILFCNIRTAIDTGKESACELMLAEGESTEYLRLTMRVIARTGDRYMIYSVLQNTTGQHMAEQARLAAEEKELESARRLEIIMENVNGGVSAIIINDDASSRLIFHNDKYYELFGYTTEQAREENLDIMSLILPEDLPKVMEKVQQLKRDRKPTMVDYRCRKRDGRIIYIRANASITGMNIFGDNVITSVITDITQQRLVTDQLEAIIGNINGAVTTTVIKDGKPEFLIVNDWFFTMHGYTPAQYEAECPDKYALIHPDDRNRIMRQFESSDGGKDRYTMEYRIITRDGKVRYVRNNISVIRIFGIDEPVQLSVANDVTELILTQMKERETASELNMVLNHVVNGITAAIIHGDKSKILFVNERFFEIHGIPSARRGDYNVSKLVELICPEDRPVCLPKVLAATKVGQSTVLEYRVARPDGETAWVKAHISVVALDEFYEPVQVTVYSDVTEEKEANEQLRFINESAHYIISQPDNDKAIGDILSRLLEYYGAKRAYVVELDDLLRKYIATAEICAPGVPSRIDSLQRISYDSTEQWLSEMRSGRLVFVRDAETIPPDQLITRNFLSEHNIQSLIIAPILREGKLVAIVGVDNPTSSLGHYERLIPLCDYISMLLMRRDLFLKVQHESDVARQLMDDTPGGFVRMQIKPDGTVIPIYCNEGFVHLVGMCREDVRNVYMRNVIDGVHPDDREFVRSSVERMINLGEVHNVQCRIRQGKEGYLPVFVTGRIMRSSTGEIYLNAYYSDATEQAKKLK